MAAPGSHLDGRFTRPGTGETSDSIGITNVSCPQFSYKQGKFPGVEYKLSVNNVSI